MSSDIGEQPCMLHGILCVKTYSSLSIYICSFTTSPTDDTLRSYSTSAVASDTAQRLQTSPPPPPLLLYLIPHQLFFFWKRMSQKNAEPLALPAVSTIEPPVPLPSVPTIC